MRFAYPGYVACLFVSIRGPSIRRPGKREWSRPLITTPRGPYVLQAYLDNIQTKIGKSPADFRKLAAKKGFADKDGLKPGVKAGDIIAWLKQYFDLGHGHSMAIVALLKGSKTEGDR